MQTLKASLEGLSKIKQARETLSLEKGWAIANEQWLEEASKFLPLVRTGKSTVPGTVSSGTWRRFLSGKAIKSTNFKAFCTVLRLNWEEVAEKPLQLKVHDLSLPDIASASTHASSNFLPRQDWGEAPDSSVFYGRTDELSILEQWIVADRSRLVVVLGIGGIGKTVLSAKLAHNLAETSSDFQFIMWRSLREAPSLHKILEDLTKFLSNQQDPGLASTAGEKISKLIDYLRSYRCLIVLDNAESILQSGSEMGQFREGYQEYSDLLKRIGEASHQSCLVITSREKPADLASLESETLPARVLRLTGLTVEAKEILETKGISGTESQFFTLVNLYSGNPLALKIIASSIKEVFNGDVVEFLSQDTTVFNEIRNLLDQQFSRLSSLEQSLMYWLSINREPVSLEELKRDFILPPSQSRLIESLEHLKWRSLIERTRAGFTLQNVVLEYMTERLIKKTSSEIRTGQPNFLTSYALFKATAKDYIRETQVRLVLEPLWIELLNILGSQKELEVKLSQILAMLRENLSQKLGYEAGNILNLLCQLKIDLRDYDFSYLNIQQAYLQNIILQGVNFAHSKFVNSIFTETFGNILSIAYNSDGTLLATGSTSNEVCLWQVANSQKIRIYKGHSDWVNSVAISPDGKTLASGCYDQTIRLWDIHSDHCLGILKEHTDLISSVTFSPDGQILASGSSDKTIKLWKTSTGECLNTFEGHTHWIWSIAFNCNGKTLVSSSRDRTIKLWDIESGRCMKTLSGHADEVRTVTFSPDGKILASGSFDCSVKLWDIQSSQCLRTLQGHSNFVLSITFSPDNQILASGSSDKTIKLWDVQSGRCLNTLQGHANEVRAIAFRPDDKILASGGFDRTIKLWNTKTGQCTNTLEGYASGMGSISFSPDGKMLASVSNTESIKLWEVQSGHSSKTLNGHTHWIWSINFSPRGQILASSSSDQTVKIWDINSGQCLRTLYGHTNEVRSTAFSPDGQILVSGSTDQTIKLWNVDTGECRKTLEGGIDEIWLIAFSSDGQTIAAACQEVKIWDTHSGRCIKTINAHNSLVFSVTFSPDGKVLASGGNDHTVKLCNVSGGDRIRTLKGHTAGVWSVAFSPDGQILASGSSDKTVKLWQVSTGQCLNTFEGLLAGIWQLAFSPDGLILASYSQDEKISFWDVKTGEHLKTLVDNPYNGMNITGVTGLTETTVESLKRLGAFEE